MSNQSKKKVLVTGASGLLGVAAIERFLDAGWDVVGVSRRKPRAAKRPRRAVDLRDQEKARAGFEPLTDVTHIAYTALVVGRQFEGFDAHRTFLGGPAPDCKWCCSND